MIKKQNEESLAKLLYIEQGLTAVEIAERLGVTEKTIGDWVKKGEWRILRASALVSTKNIASLLIQNMAAIAQAAEGRMLTDKEITNMESISRTLRNIDKKADIALYVSVFEDFYQHTRLIDTELAKKIVAVQSDFLQIKIKELNNK